MRALPLRRHYIQAVALHVSVLVSLDMGCALLAGAAGRLPCVNNIRLKPYDTTRPQSCVPPPSSKLNVVALLLAGAAGDLSRLPAGCAAVLLPGAGHAVDREAPAPDPIFRAAAPRLHSGAPSRPARI